MLQPAIHLWNNGCLTSNLIKLLFFTVFLEGFKCFLRELRKNNDKISKGRFFIVYLTKKLLLNKKNYLVFCNQQYTLIDNYSHFSCSTIRMVISGLKFFDKHVNFWLVTLKYDKIGWLTYCLASNNTEFLIIISKW